MKSQDKIREEMLLLATITLNFVTELPEYQQFLTTVKEKDLKFEKGKKEYFIAKKVLLSEATVQNVLYGSAKITTHTFNSIMDVKEFREISEKIYEGIQNNDAEIMKKVSDIIEYRIENKEFPKILEKMKKSSNRHYALPMLLQNEQLLTNVLDYLPLIEKIFESEENVTVFCQLAERLEMFKIVEEFEDWENVEQFIKSVQTRNGFDNYID
ncbi:hypothetical protein [Streptococcus suis]|uniref:hypothetical protein n=1 Tax=Streptococcus suis TaxID=1307 RepID=UPI00041147BA|nr:hypothetical protein [Streptococcus suis]